MEFPTSSRVEFCEKKVLPKFVEAFAEQRRKNFHWPRGCSFIIADGMGFKTHFNIEQGMQKISTAVLNCARLGEES